MRNMCRAENAWMRAFAFGLIALLSSVSHASAAAGDNLAVYHLTQGWATFGLALPEGEAPDAVQVGTLPTQTDVKSRWPDGSIKFAVVSAKVPATGHYAVTATDVVPETAFAPSLMPPIVVEFNKKSGDNTGLYKAEPFAGSLDRWLSGPLVRETRVVAVPNLNGTQTVPLGPGFQVIFDVRSYTGGGHRVDVTVENSLDVATADSARYDVKIIVAGEIVFRKEDVLHRYLARWRQVVTTGMVESAVAPDFGPAIRARALPNYLPTVRDGAYSVVGGPSGAVRSQYEILKTGDLIRPMNAHSGRPELAPYPDWAAQAIVHRRRGQLDYVLKNGELAGSWGIHIRNENGADLISIDERPNFWLDDRAQFDADPPKNRNLTGRAGQTLIDGDPTSGTAGDINHQPSLAYIPYLITGDRYFMEEVKFWANYILIGTYQDMSQNLRGGGYTPSGSPVFEGSRGLLTLQDEIRGIGWGLRNLADAAFILPDTDPYKSYFKEKVTNNLLWLDDYARNFNSGPLGTMFPSRRPEDHNLTPYSWIALWEHRYVGWAVDRARLLGFTQGVDFLRRLAKFEVLLYTSEANGFPREWAGIYVLAVGKHSTTPIDWNVDVVTFFDDIEEMFQVSSSIKSNPSSTIGDFYRPFEGFYGPESRLMLMVARGLELPGSQLAYDFLMSHADTVWPNGQAGGGETMMQDLNERSGWAIGLGGVNPLMTDVIPSRPNPNVLAASTTTAAQ
jgi:hypothetical protein